ncbi:MAG: MATE family efflux transporter [Desulfofustis sp.]|nr:MATE family efflux transporter [Desulfofustis sp.]
MKEQLRNWRTSQRYREVLGVCLPLVMGMAAVTVMEFTDRVFLSNYSLEAISAASPASGAAFVFLVLFGGVGSYCGVFIAQYVGAGRNNRVGAMLWQGIYFTGVAGLILLFIAAFLSGPIFTLAGHGEEIQRLETLYFRILCSGGVFYVADQTLSSFFSGRGLTRPVMIVNIIGMLINIPLDFCLIYGWAFFPELGIAGAGIATVFSSATISLILVLLIFRKTHEDRFKVMSSRGFEMDLIKRLLHFGVPGSMQLCIDISAFVIFILIVGRLGVEELAATNIALSISAIAFMPSYGTSQGVAVLVGQSLGRTRPDQGRFATISAIHLLLLYILLVDLVFIFSPEIVVAIFIPETASAEYRPVMDKAVTIMRIMACYLFLDALYMIFAGVLKGAGDTGYLMFAILAASICCFLIPLWIGIELFDRGIYFAWGCVLSFVFSLFLFTWLRYRKGRWQQMSVI